MATDIYYGLNKSHDTEATLIARWVENNISNNVYLIYDLWYIVGYYVVDALWLAAWHDSFGRHDHALKMYRHALGSMMATNDRDCSTWRSILLNARIFAAHKVVTLSYNYAEAKSALKWIRSLCPCPNSRRLAAELSVRHKGENDGYISKLGHAEQPFHFNVAEEYDDPNLQLSVNHAEWGTFWGPRLQERRFCSEGSNRLFWHRAAQDAIAECLSNKPSTSSLWGYRECDRYNWYHIFQYYFDCLGTDSEDTYTYAAAHQVLFVRAHHCNDWRALILLTQCDDSDCWPDKGTEEMADDI